MEIDMLSGLMGVFSAFANLNRQNFHKDGLCCHSQCHYNKCCCNKNILYIPQNPQIHEKPVLISGMTRDSPIRCGTLHTVPSCILYTRTSAVSPIYMSIGPPVR